MERQKTYRELVDLEHEIGPVDDVRKEGLSEAELMRFEPSPEVYAVRNELARRAIESIHG